VLGAVKTEFSKFGEALAHTRKKLEEASQSIVRAETRTRQLSRKLKDVEALPIAVVDLATGDGEGNDAGEKDGEDTRT
jgi:DNA recombination protein RmuC